MIRNIQSQAESERQELLAQLQAERSRQETVVCKKMDKIILAKQEADLKYEQQRKELESLKSKLTSAQSVDESRRMHLQQQQAKMQKDLD